MVALAFVLTVVAAYAGQAAGLAWPGRAVLTGIVTGLVLGVGFRELRRTARPHG